MVKIDINNEECIGCGVCANSCPVGIYEMKDDKAAIAGNLDDCTLCKVCEDSCPSGSITITE